MSLLNDIINMFSGQHPQAKPQQAPHLMEVGPGGRAIPSNQGNLPPAKQKDTWMSNDPSAMLPPDITYNPNQNTNIPYSAHSPQLAQLGNQYMANPTAPQFKNVDPAMFGFPADNTVSSVSSNMFKIPRY